MDKREQVERDVGATTKQIAALKGGVRLPAVQVKVNDFENEVIFLDPDGEKAVLDVLVKATQARLHRLEKELAGLPKEAPKK